MLVPGAGGASFSFPGVGSGAQSKLCGSATKNQISDNWQAEETMSLSIYLL
jgi:hypothetical protein